MSNPTYMPQATPHHPPHWVHDSDHRGQVKYTAVEGPQASSKSRQVSELAQTPPSKRRKTSHATDIMTTGKVLFDIPFQGAHTLDFPGNGNVVCSQPRAGVYLLTFAHAPDNRVTTAFCQTMILALDVLEHRYSPGVVITTSSVPKFYSNGMDIEHSATTRAYFPQSLYALWKRLLTFPMPTVALVNGHAFAGGMMVVMMHDYRVMNPHKGYLCLNELELGMPLRRPMMAVFRMKLSAATLRKMVLEAYRYKALEALKEGIVDHVGGLDETLVFVDELKLVQKAQPGASGASPYGQLKREMWRETVLSLEDWAGEAVEMERTREIVQEEKAIGLKKVELWEGERGFGKTKL